MGHIKKYKCPLCFSTTNVVKFGRIATTVDEGANAWRGNRGAILRASADKFRLLEEYFMLRGEDYADLFMFLEKIS